MGLALFDLTTFYRKNAYVSDYRCSESRVGQIAAILFVSNFFFMTRLYAMSNAVETILFGLFLFTPTLRRQFLLTLRDPAIIPLALFFVWALFSGIWSNESLVRVIDDWWGWRKLLLLPIGMVILNDERILKVSILVAVMVGLLFLGLATSAWALDIKNIWGRPHEHVLQNYNAQGIYFSILATGLAVVSYVGRRAMLMTLLKWMVALSLIGFIIFLGSSRSGYVASAVAMMVIVFHLFRGKKMAFLVAVVVTVSVFSMSPIANQRVQQAVSELAVGLEATGGSEGSGSIRAVFWKNTLGIINEHWLIGAGAAGFDEAYHKQVADQSGWRATRTDDPHSHHLHIWAEYGLVGLALFFWFFVGIFFRADLGSPWGWVLLGALLTSCMVGVFDGVFGSAVNGRIIILALAVSLASIQNDSKALLNNNS